MQPPAFPRSWYAETANPHPRHPVLEGETACDVCVVGGGYTGLTAALELAGRGFDVVLLEAERVGWGASGRNGGQLITGYNKPMSTIESWVGPEDARRLWDLNLEATDLVRRRVERHAIACDLTWGFLYAAVKRRHLDDIAAIEADLGGRYGYPSLRRLDRAEVATVVRSDAYVGGLLDAGSGHLHPLNYALGLADAAAAAGVRVFEESRALSIGTGAAPRVTTARGSVRARWLVLGCNAYVDGLSPRLDGWIMPVATYMMATESLGRGAATTLLPANAAVSDMNFVLNYFRRSTDHRLLFGGGVSYSGLDRPGLQRTLRRKMLRVFPELDNARVDLVWGGHVAITVNRMPQVGRLSPTTYYAHGYSGHGVALAGMAGLTIAEAVAGTAERFDVFARIPHRPFPGGRWLRTPALVLAMLWFRMRDLL